MKNVVKILILILSLFTIIGCSNNGMDQELARIKNELPSSFNDDVVLPTSDEFEVIYDIIGSEIVDGILMYQSPEKDTTVTLTIKVKNKNKEAIAYYDLTMLYKENTDNTATLQNLSDQMDGYAALLPVSISTDYTLPEYEFKDVTDSKVKVYSSLACIGGVYQYNYPQTCGYLRIEVTLEKGKTSISRTFEIPVLTMEEKNSVPRIYLEVEGEITKETYLDGTFVLEEKGEDGNWYDSVEETAIRIKGRGNSTWGFDKKPYKIKFDSRISLFGGGKAKTWTLIANYIDHSLMRNYAAYYLGRSLDGLAHTTEANFVDVYLNGEYQGNYLLCEQTEVDKNRLKLDEDDTKIDTGYLLELDGKYFESNTGVEGRDYFYCSMHAKDYLFAVHTPDPEDSTLIEEQVAYIKDYLQEAVLVLKGNTDAMYDYFDLDSAVDSFIVNEITKNKDVGWSSFYIYKDAGGKFCFGPIWDYDLSSLGQGNISKEERSAVGWYTKTSYKNPFYDYFIRNATFNAAVKARWEEIKDKQLKDLIEELYRVKDYIYYSATQNFKVWDVIGKETGWWISDEEHALSTWPEQVDLLINYYKDRIKWISENIDTLGQ